MYKLPAELALYPGRVGGEKCFSPPTKPRYESTSRIYVDDMNDSLMIQCQNQSPRVLLRTKKTLLLGVWI